MLSLNRSDLVEKMSDRHTGLPVSDMEAAVRIIQDTMSEALVTGNRIEIRGFGSFSLNYRRARQGRNPKTGEQVQVKASYVPHFKARKELKTAVNKSTQRG